MGKRSKAKEAQMQQAAANFVCHAHQLHVRKSRDQGDPGFIEQMLVYFTTMLTSFLRGMITLTTSRPSM